MIFLTQDTAWHYQRANRAIERGDAKANRGMAIAIMLAGLLIAAAIIFLS